MRAFPVVILGLLTTVGALPAATAQTLAVVQTAAPAAIPHSDLSSLRYDRSDTLRAVQHLFMQRSKATRGWLQAGTGILVEGAVKKVVAKASKRKNQPEYVQDFYEDLDQQASQDIVVGALMTGYGAYRLSRFGPGQYRRVVVAYQEGQPLPPYLTRKLKTKYFRLLPIGSRKERAQAVR
ncbi:hypothetical protein [Hymenobacter rubripertinctus]|uniref:Uncharacterized protein n=1 Tax=Hymenobacter rubripertinctus TaxID=2029981 RepID=A0A418R0Q1_9BACT|nr:hypothetical protein [Hymenobacter rubripertinctus]RIY11002.1 hypothetical protein D0T11_08305 [Hymenobacter rubripertinctus]